MKPHQHTFAREYCFVGQEPYGGNFVEVRLLPAAVNSGYIFRTEYGDVPATLDTASARGNTLSLNFEEASVVHVEHILATLRYGCDVDNVIIEVRRQEPTTLRPARWLGMATKCEVIPTAPERELYLCQLCGAGSGSRKCQWAPRRDLTVFGSIADGKLSVLGTRALQDARSLSIRARTLYKHIGLQSFRCHISDEVFRDELAKARPLFRYPYLARFSAAERILASLAFPSYGCGTGLRRDTFFYPQNSAAAWRSEERVSAEIARHSIVDRLGAFALLPGKLVGVHVEAFLSGHANDIAFLSRYRERFVSLSGD